MSNNNNITINEELNMKTIREQLKESRVRIYRKCGVWYFIGNKFQGASTSFPRLIEQAKRAGE